ncbi:putative OPT family oligopeptide transporter [Catalinimonas alkaloidigena]|uniref:OPT family oligopeptide transporter n=1 Tax=Catalinimonas alkaloidigena TaxID=1075417 RepID=UPI002404A940|nr:oligopeptide transporter, OPT family [Catalinimonas alkaloidigena]MDF9797336.1 putative OPT family oligopeptide transporter [Catalinimonas alkaloidigena]
MNKAKPAKPTATDPDKPYIGADQKLPELTLKAILLGAGLSVILSAANAYFGLFAGLTVSASIPAAVISMAVLRLFKNSNILENNLVQTAASAGESIAAGVIFTIPALIIMGYWDEFNYWETTLIAMTGGILGVLFTIPLRQALIVKENLKFPEGVATSEVLKTGETGGQSVKYLVWGALVGGLFKLSESALNLWNGLFEQATLINNRVYLYLGINLSPALVAVGYIVGLNIAFLVFLGGAISWYIAIPVYIAALGPPEGAADPEQMGIMIWSSQIRYLGVGAMIVGGLWALISLKNSLGTAFKSGVEAFKQGSTNFKDQLRTEMDTPMSWVIIAIGVMIVPVFAIYLREIHDVGITGLMAFIMVIAGFLFSAVAGYMAGLVGSSNNPISGVTIATILASALLLLFLLGASEPARGAAAAILIGAVVCCAAAIAGDNMQDLKAGYILGATPYKQQVMQVVGVVAGALAIAPVLNYLLQGYGIGAPTPEQPEALAAPQATLMQSVASGIFGEGLPWGMVSIGGAIAVVIIIIDQYLKKQNSEFRMPVLAVAVGLYLPLELDTSIFIGGIIAWMTSRFMTKRGTGDAQHAEATEKASNAGLLLASGLITGEALMGIFIAIGIVVTDLSSLRVFENPPGGSYSGLAIFIVVVAGLYALIKKVFKENIGK